MSVALIWAMASNRVIGLNNDIPWRGSLPADMAFFRRTTTGHTVLMGRKTFESIGSKPLPNRRNVVMTRNPAALHEEVEAVSSIEEALERFGKEPLFVMGGSDIYKLFLPYADKLYMTRIKQDFEGDTFFPEFDLNEWRLAEHIPGERNEKNPYDYGFYIYERI